MRSSTAEIERQAKAILDSVESGVELIDERARPFVERNGVTILAAGIAVLVGVGAAVMIVRWRRRRHWRGDHRAGCADPAVPRVHAMELVRRRADAHRSTPADRPVARS